MSLFSVAPSLLVLGGLGTALTAVPTQVASTLHIPMTMTGAVLGFAIDGQLDADSVTLASGPSGRK